MLLSSLGLIQSDVISFDQTFLDTLYAWLNGQDMHFGKSAFESLKKMLETNGVLGIDLKKQ